MSRGVVTADWHVGVKTHSVLDKETGLPSRWNDVWKSANYVVDYAIQNSADFFWLLGDVFHTNHPTPTELYFTVEILKRLEEAGIQTIVFNGNHDYVAGSKMSAASALDGLGKWENVKFFSEIGYETGHGWGAKIIPHGFNIADVQQKRALSRELLLCHTTFDGCVVGSENFMLSSQVKPLPKGCDVDLILSGHIHKAQRLVDSYGKNVDVIYPGSIERVDFGEENEEKIFLWLDAETLECQDIPIPARQMLTIRSSAETIDEFEAEIADKEIKDRIIRVILDNSLISRGVVEDAVRHHEPHIVSQVKMNKMEVISSIEEEELDEDSLIEQMIRDRLDDETEILRALEIVKEIQNGV